MKMGLISKGFSYKLGATVLGFFIVATLLLVPLFGNNFVTKSSAGVTEDTDGKKVYHFVSKPKKTMPKSKSRSKKVCYNDKKYTCKPGYASDGNYYNYVYIGSKCVPNIYGYASVYDNPACPLHFHRPYGLQGWGGWGDCVRNDLIKCRN